MGLGGKRRGKWQSDHSLAGSSGGRKKTSVGSDELYVAAATVVMGRYNSWKSIPKMRVVSTVSNMSAFYSILGCE